MIYPFLTTGRFRLPFLNRKLEKWRKAGDGYVDAFIGMMRGAGVDLSFITKESLRNQFYSDLITPRRMRSIRRAPRSTFYMP